MNKAALHAQQLKQDAKCAHALGMSLDEWMAHKEQAKHESRMNALPQVDALMAAGWKWELPAVQDSEPWQWYWRRPPRRKGSKGRLFLSTNQAYQALMREKRSSNEENGNNPGGIGSRA